MLTKHPGLEVRPQDSLKISRQLPKQIQPSQTHFSHHPSVTGWTSRLRHEFGVSDSPLAKSPTSPGLPTSADH
jgi:hypothetical protein